MTPEMIGQDILWFFQGMINILIPFSLAFIALHIYYTNK